jgi:small ligand-binding sensory domain FIST
VPAEEVPRINRELGIGAASPVDPLARHLLAGDPLAGDVLAGDVLAGDLPTSDLSAAEVQPGAEIHRVQGADRANGAIAAGAVEVGATVRFWVRGDPASDLRAVLVGRAADAALAFTGDPAGRGYHAADLAHDAEIIAEALGVSRLAGLVAPGQIGPGGTFRGAASLALFADR